jgi:hypothetical protein|tara:strand:+ start:444 stop:803 length:360 start_codon:yes stop_codon:yes gene_type:complete
MSVHRYKANAVINNDYEKIEKMFTKELSNLSLTTLVDIIPPLIKCVEKYKALNGSEKKELVLELLMRFIDKTDGFGDDAIVDPILKSIAPSIIDNLIKVDKKNIVLKKKGKCFLFKILC